MRLGKCRKVKGFVSLGKQTLGVHLYFLKLSTCSEISMLYLQLRVSWGPQYGRPNMVILINHLKYD
jgi:hypothetical protein